MTCDVCGTAPVEGLGGSGLCGRCRRLPGVFAARWRAAAPPAGGSERGGAYDG